MKSITIEALAYKGLTAKIDMIAKFFTGIAAKAEEGKIDGLFNNCEVCAFFEHQKALFQKFASSQQNNILSNKRLSSSKKF